ncbi:hypothetical protein PO909_014263, partial [Leuciscus waleckii]
DHDQLHHLSGSNSANKHCRKQHQVVRLVCAYGHSWKGWRTGTCPNLEPECADRIGVRFAEHDPSPVERKLKETRHLTVHILLT